MARFSSTIPPHSDREGSALRYGDMLEQCGDCGLFDRNCQYCRAWARVLSPRSSIWKNCPFKVPYKSSCEVPKGDASP